MAMNRLDVKTDTNARKAAIISVFVFISAALVCFRLVDTRLAIAEEPESASPQLLGQDKPDTRSRWSEEKIDEIWATLIKPKARWSTKLGFGFSLNAESARNLAMAHGVHDPDEAHKWYLNHPNRQYRGLYFDLRGIPLKDRKLRNADLRYTDLKDADLSGCDLTNADLTGAILRGADLSGANLQGANLDHTILIKADLSGAWLSRASLRQALLYDSKLVEAALLQTHMEGAQFADFHSTITRKVLERWAGSDEMEHPSLLSPANLSRSNLYGANLSGAVLGNANLEGASLYMVKFADTLIDVAQLDKALHYKFIKPGVLSSRINVSQAYLQFVEAFHRESKVFFAGNGMAEMAAEYHYWEQEVKTYKPETPLYSKVLRIALMKWPYGYGSKPMWLFYYSFSVVLIFAMLFVLFTINKKKSGIYKVLRENGQEKVTVLSWRKGLLLADCLYFSLLSLATFGYGVLQPRQWVEFFRFEPVELRPLGWARILVGLEAVVGIYLLALLTTVIFGKG
jgi:uncharacterized protein YjbI with pentapeptide repeats